MGAKLRVVFSMGAVFKGANFDFRPFQCLRVPILRVQVRAADEIFLRVPILEF